VVLALLPLEVEDGVHDVLERLGPGQAAVLRDVADEEDGHPVALGQEQQLGGDLAHLRDTARRRREARGVDGLDGVHHQGGGLQRLELFEDALQRGLAHEEQRAALDSETLAPHLDLALGLLPGDVEDGAAAPAQEMGHLQQQRALPDPGLPPDEDHGSRDDAAAQDAVELADARRDALGLHRVHGVVGPRLAQGRRQHGPASLCGRGCLLALLGEAVPLAAVRAAPQPLRALEAAGLAGEDGLGLAQRHEGRLPREAAGEGHAARRRAGAR
jgi:hypothetical protein